MGGTPEVVLAGERLFVVENIYDFILEVAHACRNEELNVPITAITSSAGKSTTSAMIAHALKGVGVSGILENTGWRRILCMSLPSFCQGDTPCSGM